MTDATWRRRLSSAASRSMRAARDRLDGRWDLDRAGILPSRYAPRSPTSTSISTRARTLSSRKSGLPSVRSMSRCPDRVQRRIVAQQRLQELAGGVGRQGIDPELPVVALVAPGLLILGPVVHREQDGRGRQALDEGIQQPLGLGVDPVEILENQDQRLRAASRSSTRLTASSVRARRTAGSSPMSS